MVFGNQLLKLKAEILSVDEDVQIECADQITTLRLNIQSTLNFKIQDIKYWTCISIFNQFSLFHILTNLKNQTNIPFGFL